MSASSEFKITFQEKTLEKIYSSSVKFNYAIGIDRINTKSFENNLKYNISVIRNKSLNGTYAFSQFREKLLSRGAEKYPRVISIPTIRDKLVLKALCGVLHSVYGTNLPFLHKIVNEVACGVSKVEYDGVLRLDVKDFYPSIRHDLLMTLLSKKIRKKEILHLISNAISQKTVSKPTSGSKIFNTKGIPQGLSISNVLANVYMQPIDRKYQKRISIHYFRYVDDILILCSQKKTEKIKNEIIKDCDGIGLTIHADDPAKICTGKICSGFSYLGYVFNDSLVTVRKKSLDNLRESILRLLTNYKYSEKHDMKLLSWTLNTRITGCIFNETKYGWMFFFSQINDLQLLASLDHFVKKQLVRFGVDPRVAKIKRFTRAYHEITKNLTNTKYIPNFDNTTLREKREILRDIFGIKAKRMKRYEIEYQFKRKIFRTVKDLERDLARPS